MKLTELMNQALALHQSGRLKEAAPIYERALAQRPRDAQLLALAGALQSQLGKYGLAVNLLQRALVERPHLQEALHNLGATLMKLTRHAEAAEAFATVTRLSPEQPAGWLGLGQALRGQGEGERAAAAFRQVLALAPDHPLALAVLGMLLDESGAPAEAEPLLRRATELQPDQPGWHNSLGLVRQHLRRLDDAKASFRTALRLDPDSEAAASNSAELMLQQRNCAAAIDMLDKTIAARDAARKPVSGHLLGVLLGARMLACDWRGQAGLLQRIQAAKGEPPHLLYQDVSPERLRRMTEGLAARQRRSALSAPLVGRSPETSDGRIRLGYLSNDFHKHATAYLIAEVLERHDRTRFEVTAYSGGPDDGSAMRQRLRAAVESFHDVSPLSDRALVERIAADGITLLVDLKGWTEDCRLPALAWRPAPIQATWLGYPGTLGADWIDYAIVDHVIVPPGMEAHFTEKLVVLPDCYQPNDRQRRIDATPDREAAGLPPSGLILACFCQSMKITAEVFSIWMRALAATPGAVLWLIDAPPEAMANLRREAAARGVDPVRLIFAPKLPLEQHLARYRLVDLALDTYPYGSHTTASDALWAGCPQLAITGRAFAARVSTSIVSAMGLPELAAAGLDAHEALLLRLCQDTEARVGLRRKLAARRDTAPLFDSQRFVRHLEAGYTAMVARHSAGLQPAQINVTAEASHQLCQSAIRSNGIV